MKKIFLSLIVVVFSILIVACAPGANQNVLGDVTPAEAAQATPPPEKEALAGQATKWENCVDSDNAGAWNDKEQLLTKSTTTYSGGSKEDQCYTWYEGTAKEKTRLIEGVCKKTGRASRFNYYYTDCDAAFGKGAKCVDGKCVKPVQATENIQQTCTPYQSNLVDNNLIIGDSNAPVMLVSWVDFESSDSATFWNAKAKFWTKYGNKYISSPGTPKIKLVIRNFPQTESAKALSVALECVAEVYPKKYAQAVDLLSLKEYQDMSKLANTMQYQGGFDIEAFNNCVEKCKQGECTAEAEVEKDIADAKKLNLVKAPTLFIDDEKVDSLQSIDIEAKIEEKLAKQGCPGWMPPSFKGSESCTNPAEFVGCSDLSNFPNCYIKDGKFEASLVVGAYATSIVNLAMTDFAASLNFAANLGVGTSKLDVEISNSNSCVKNTVSFGNVCTNFFSAYLLGNPKDCSLGLKPGQGIVKLVELPGGYSSVVIAGYSDEDTRKLVKAIIKGDVTLSGKEFKWNG